MASKPSSKISKPHKLSASTRKPQNIKKSGKAVPKVKLSSEIQGKLRTVSAEIAKLEKKRSLSKAEKGSLAAFRAIKTRYLQGWSPKPRTPKQQRFVKIDIDPDDEEEKRGKRKAKAKDKKPAPKPKNPSPAKPKKDLSKILAKEACQEIGCVEIETRNGEGNPLQIRVQGKADAEDSRHTRSQ